MIHDQSHPFFQSLWETDHCEPASSCTDRKAGSRVASLSLPVINLLNIFQKWVIQRDYWPKHRLKCNKETVVKLEVKFESNGNGLTEATADHGNVNTITVRTTGCAAAGTS